MNIHDRIIEGILTKLAGRAESNIKSGAKWAGKKAKEGLAYLGKKTAYGAGKLVGKGLAAVKRRMGESSTYDRIINILLEARIEDYIDRLDERSAQAKANKAKKTAWQATHRDDEQGPKGENTADEDEAENWNHAKMGRRSTISTPQSRLARGRENLKRKRGPIDVALQGQRTRSAKAFLRSLKK